MTPDLSLEIAERHRITNSFPPPIPRTGLVATDITDHRYWLEKVYSKLFIVEAGVVDECCRRFEREFGR